MSEIDPFQSLLAEPDQNSGSVRRIVLPSGRTIEVVRFDGEKEKEQGMHVCPECDSKHVQPIEWSESSEMHMGWNITLQCPNCEWESDGVYPNDDVRHFEDKLDEGLEDMVSALNKVSQFIMAEEVERFCSALQGDHILPEDF